MASDTMHTCYIWHLLVAAIMSAAVSASGSTTRIPAMVQAETISDYLYQTDLPAFTEMTACWWYDGEPDADDYNADYLISMATSSNTNMLLLGLSTSGDDHFILSINGASNAMPTRLDDLHLLEDLHLLCFTWKAGGYARFYMDVTTPGSPQVIAQRAATTHTVDGGAALIVHQEQDAVLGSLDVSQTSMGTIGWFNMWDYEMTPDQIAELSTSQQGNIVNWNTLQVQGSPTFTTLDVPVNPNARSGSKVDVPVGTTASFTRQASTKLQYLYQEGMPSLTEFSLCFWFDGDATNDDDNWASDMVFGMATASVDNALLMTTDGNGDMGLYVTNTWIAVMSGSQSKMPVFNDRHLHCFTWKSGSYFKWYVDTIIPGRPELYVQQSSSGSTIPSGAAAMMFHDQDSYLGGLDTNQVMTGWVSQVNLWSFELTADQVLKVSPESRGNLINPDTLLTHGSPPVTDLTFTSYQRYGMPSLMERVGSQHMKLMPFCKIPGTRLVGDTLQTIQDRDEAECLQECNKNSQCMSFNLYTDSGTGYCQLNKDSTDAALLTTASVTDHVHYSSYQCADLRLALNL